jgi:hypothetical protein
VSPDADDATGLTELTLPELRQLLRGIQSGALKVPLSPTALQADGLGSALVPLRALGQLDATALIAVLRTAIAERVGRPVPKVDLVWTGPEPRVSRTRDTAVVVRELFASARETILVAGFAFDHADDILRPLHGVMRDHGVQASLFVDLTVHTHTPPNTPDAAPAAAEQFLARTWPFGPPFPRVFYDKRTADRGTRTSLHAKVVVIDERCADRGPRPRARDRWSVARAGRDRGAGGAPILIA